MAGYIIYSLDWDCFDQFVKQPAETQLLAFADLFSQAVENDYDEFEEGDPVKNWPVEPEALSPQLKAILSQNDWYRGLSDTGKSILERHRAGFLHGREQRNGLSCG